MAKELKSKSVTDYVEAAKMQSATEIEFVGEMNAHDATQVFLNAKNDPNWAKQLAELQGPNDFALKVSTHENGSLNIMAAQRDDSGKLSVYPNLTENMVGRVADVTDMAYIGGTDVGKKLRLIQDAGIGEVDSVHTGIDGMHTKVKFDMEALRKFDPDGVANHEATAVKNAELVTNRFRENNMYSSKGRRLPSMGDDLLEMERMSQHQSSVGDFGDQ